MILLTGITGTCGRQILELLGRQNIPVRALVRDPDRALGLAGPDVELVKGDLGDAASLENALKGIDRAFLLMANVEEQLALEKGFIDVAKKLRTPHVVKLSASGADAASKVELKRYHGEAEQYLAQSGLGYTNVRPNFFMQNMLHCAVSIVAEDRFYLPFARGRTGIIDVADVAAFIVETLTGDNHEGKTYDISGSEILSFYDLATQMTEELGRQITYVDVPAEDFREQLKNWSPSPWYVNAVMEQFALTAKDHGAMITDTFEDILGRKPRSFRQFVREHAAAFTPA